GEPVEAADEPAEPLAEAPSNGRRGRRFGGSPVERGGASAAEAFRAEIDEAMAAEAEVDVDLEEKFNTDGRLRFNFKGAPYQEVLEWFAEQADLSLVLESPPPGTFNYRDSKSYTAAEAL